MSENHAVRRAETLTIAASCCGVTGETVLTDSAIIMLYLAALGAGNAGSLISTSVLPLFTMAWPHPSATERGSCP